MAVYLVETLYISYKDDDCQGHGVRTLSAKSVSDMKRKIDNLAISREDVLGYTNCSERILFESDIELDQIYNDYHTILDKLVSVVMYCDELSKFKDVVNTSSLNNIKLDTEFNIKEVLSKANRELGSDLVNKLVYSPGSDSPFTKILSKIKDQ